MTQRLDKRPLTMHGLMRQFWIQAAGALDGAVPRHSAPLRSGNHSLLAALAWTARLRS